MYLMHPHEGYQALTSELHPSYVKLFDEEAPVEVHKICHTLLFEWETALLLVRPFERRHAAQKSATVHHKDCDVQLV